MLTNQLNIPLSVAVFLATDEYLYQPGKISASSLYKPIKQQILSKQVPADQRSYDIAGKLKSSMGTAIHNGIEKAWKTNYRGAMKLLGYPQNAIDSIRLNPEEHDVAALVRDPSVNVIFTERRKDLQLGGHTVTGEYDFSLAGRLRDFKATSTFAYTKQTRAKDFMMQGSIYRAIHTDTITDSFIDIDYIFWDWRPGEVGKGNYPSAPVVAQTIPLMEVDETTDWMQERLRVLGELNGATEVHLDECTREELWMDEPVYKYYANPEKLGRATKNFDNPMDAEAFKQSKGKGIVIEQHGQAKACLFCNAFPICKQKDRLIESGLLSP